MALVYAVTSPLQQMACKFPFIFLKTLTHMLSQSPVKYTEQHDRSKHLLWPKSHITKLTNTKYYALQNVPTFFHLNLVPLFENYKIKSIHLSQKDVLNLMKCKVLFYEGLSQQRVTSRGGTCMVPTTIFHFEIGRAHV